MTASTAAWSVTYGGYLLWIAFRAGKPETDVFSRFDVQIPAITLMTMDAPTFARPFGYCFMAVLLIWQSNRIRVSKKMCAFCVMAAACGTLIPYAVYTGLAELPGEKFMTEMSNSGVGANF